MSIVSDLPVGSVVAYFWTDGSGPTVYVRTRDDGWVGTGMENYNLPAPCDEFEGTKPVVLHVGGAAS